MDADTPAITARRTSRLVAVAAAALALAPAAAAHGPTHPGTGYISNVSAVVPNVLGVSANVLGGDAQLRLSNYSGKEIVILGYQGEPYLRFDKSGVFQNMRSPAAYLNRVRYPGTAVPALADPTAPPRWQRVAQGATFAWRDHRIHWLGKDPPPGVQRQPKKIQRVFTWRVPGRSDDKPFAITGILGYAPSATAAGGRNWLLPVVVGGVSVLALMGLWATHRRVRRVA